MILLSIIRLGIKNLFCIGVTSPGRKKSESERAKSPLPSSMSKHQVWKESPSNQKKSRIDESHKTLENVFKAKTGISEKLKDEIIQVKFCILVLSL